MLRNPYGKNLVPNRNRKRGWKREANQADHAHLFARFAVQLLNLLLPLSARLSFFAFPTQNPPVFPGKLVKLDFLW